MIPNKAVRVPAVDHAARTEQQHDPDGHRGDVHNVASTLLRSTGQRYTRSRRAVVDVLAHEARPMTLPEILAGDPALAQSSTYRNLAELVEAGVVRRIITSDEYSHFELAEHLTGDHHHHLICSSCGAVEDFTVPGELEELIDRAAATVARRRRYAVDHHRLDLVGLCPGCS
jgi:Fur family transcriptional regulator, ferric uptake regulator